MSEPERRRRRPAISCTLCRRRKLKCNREIPCGNCLRSRNAVCVYATTPAPVMPAINNPPQESRSFSTINQGTSTRSSSTALGDSPSISSHILTVPARESPGTESDVLHGRIKQLEEQLALSLGTQNLNLSPSVLERTQDVDTISSNLGGTFHFHHQGSSVQPSRAITHGVTHKKRLFGQSHWLNTASLFRDIFQIINDHVQEDTSRTLSGLQRCKSLARAMKSSRIPPRPSMRTATFPPKPVTEEIVECYIRNTETIYRILHIPTLRKATEDFWMSETKPHPVFPVQLALVLAIGAVTCDDKFSMRASAVRWVYEAQDWLSKSENTKPSLELLQINILLLIARELVDIGGDPIWIPAGELYRKAIYMGLHRDPSLSPKATVFAAEMHRRLWNTILELCLQSCMTSGGPPLISLEDFNTKIPTNLDDDELVAEGSKAKPEQEFTQTSVAIALRITFPIRLAIAKFLNDLKSHGNYEEMMRLDKQFRINYKTLCRTLQACSSNTTNSPSRFETSVVDLLMSRCLLALHTPFFGPALSETTHAYSRRIVVETSLKIWRAQYLLTDSTNDNNKELNRLTTSGSGYYRIMAFQAALLIAVELRTQLQEEESLGPIFLRADLVAVLEEAKIWCLQCIQSGETSIKGYLLTTIVTAEIDALRRGEMKDRIPRTLAKAAEDAVETCLAILEGMVPLGQVSINAGAIEDMSLHNFLDGMDDWDFTMSDAFFSPGDININPLSWTMDDESRSYETPQSMLL